MRISLIYLAAGNSRRFGTNKLLYPWEGKPLYRHLLDRLVSTAFRHQEWEILVVTQYPQIARQVREMAPALNGRIQAVLSQDSPKGASYSIRAGLAAAAGSQACGCFVADQPYLAEQTAENFLATMEKSQAELGCVVCRGERGNPAWFSRKYFPALERLEGDQGGQKVLERYQDRVMFVEVLREQELMDLDQPCQIGHKVGAGEHRVGC